VITGEGDRVRFNEIVFKERVMKSLHWIALVLVVVGAINWGLVGLFQFDLVATLFGGPDAVLSRIVYSLVGLAGVVIAATSYMLYANPRITSHHQSPAGGVPAR
jgi:uncharacterized protein